MLAGTWDRQGYRGSSNDDLWICDASGHNSRRLTTFNGQDTVVVRRAGQEASGAQGGASPTGRKARYYTITAAGRRRLGQEISEFDNVLAAIARVLQRA